MRYNNLIGGYIGVPRDFDGWIDHFFDSPCREDKFLVNDSRAIPVDLIESDEAYVIHMNLPGINKEDVKISNSKNTLSIKASRKVSKEEEKPTFLCKERFYGELQRKINLPQDSDIESIKAKMKNGVLTLSIKKSHNKIPREISIS